MINVELWEQKKKEKNLTFDELSQISGIPKRTILGIFRKEVLTPRIDTVQAIERALGLDAVTVEERAAGNVDSAKISVNADQMEWLDIYDEIVEKRGKETAAALKEVLRNILD